LNGLNSLIPGTRRSILFDVLERCFHSLGLVGLGYGYTAHGAGGKFPRRGISFSLMAESGVGALSTEAPDA